MTLQEHSLWLGRFRAAATKKSFRIVSPKGEKDVAEIDISILHDQPAPGGSIAEQPGWVVDVRYSRAPDVVLFTATYVSEDLARKVMEDLSLVAAEVDGLLRQEKFDEASEKTKALLNKFKANGGQPASIEEGD